MKYPYAKFRCVKCNRTMPTEWYPNYIDVCICMICLPIEFKSAPLKRMCTYEISDQKRKSGEENHTEECSKFLV